MGYTYLNLLDSPELLQILMPNYHNKAFTAKLLRQGYRYFKLRKAFRKTLTSRWGLTICIWLGPPWFNYWFPFTLAYCKFSHEYSSLFITVINLIFMFSL